jgi:hypothetical protein
MSTGLDQTRGGVLWPRGRKTVAVRPLAKRLDTLDGLTIAELSAWPTARRSRCWS